MRGGKSKTVAASKKDDTMVSGKRKAVNAGSKKPAKKGKDSKDANKPKRPASAFFVFMEDFRTEFKEKNPKNKMVSLVSKAGGEKWKSLSEEEKAPYVAKAAKRKVEYEKTMAAFNKKQTEGTEENASADEDAEEGSDKSKSEVEDEDEDEDEDEGSGEEEEEDSE